MARTKFAVLPLLLLGLTACAQSTPVPKPVASVPVYVPRPKAHVVVRHKPRAKPAQNHAIASKSADTAVADAASTPQPHSNAIPDAGE
jgi:hypothetical protein